MEDTISTFLPGMNLGSLKVFQNRQLVSHNPQCTQAFKCVISLLSVCLVKMSMAFCLLSADTSFILLFIKIVQKYDKYLECCHLVFCCEIRAFCLQFLYICPA